MKIKSVSDFLIAVTLLPVLVVFVPFIGPILAMIYWIVWLYGFVGIVILNMELRNWITGSYR